MISEESCDIEERSNGYYHYRKKIYIIDPNIFYSSAYKLLWGKGMKLLNEKQQLLSSNLI